MGKYLSPPDPSQHEIKCAIIFYPDDAGAFFLNAVRGQLSELARPFVWEGDRAKQDEIAQIFTETDIMTDGAFFALDCEDVKIITGEETLNITLNCNCCGSASPTTLVCYDENGQAVINPGPYTPDPKPPTGGDWPMEPDTSDPPTDFADWDEYDSNACAAANSLYKVIVWVLVAAHEIIDLAVDLATALILIAALFPAKVAEVLSSGFLARFAEALIKLASHSEDAKDWLESALAYVEGNQQVIVCTLYANRHNIPGMRLAVANQITAYVVDLFTLGVGDEDRLRDFLTAAMPLDVFMSWFVTAGTYVQFTVDPIDCSLCNPLGAVSYDYDELHTTGQGHWGQTTTPGWRADNGGEAYTIGHVTDINRYLRRTPLLTFWGEAHVDVASWTAQTVSFEIARNVAQAIDTEFYVRFNYRDGTYADVARSGTTDATYKTFTFSNPNPHKELWDSQAADVPGIQLFLPADPASSTWYEYFITRSRTIGYYVPGTYVDYGDTRP